MSTRYALSISQCPYHGTLSVCLDDDIGGLRLTPSKCCGQWVSTKSWPLTESSLRELSKNFKEAADNLERNPPHD